MSKGEENCFQWPIIGHSNIVSYLKKSLLSEKVSHAYLFAGPLHIGKTTVTENFVNSLVCENLHQGKGPVPCNVCKCCQQVANKIHPDINWLGREINEKTDKLKKNISIEQIRALQGKLSLHSFLNSYKVAVINEAETLSQEAANSLLKTLEEPTAKTVIILLATSISRLPKTIVSRCQVIKFLPVNTKEILDYLIGLKVDRKKAKTLAVLSSGFPGLAINYFTKPDEYNDFKEKVKQFVNLLKNDINYRFKTVGELINSSDIDETKEYLEIWTGVLRDLVLIKNSTPNLINNLSLATDLEELVDCYSKDNLIKIIKEVKLAKCYLDANVNPKLTLENLVLNF